MVRAPAGGLEGRCVEEAIVEGDESLAYSVGDVVEVAASQPVRDQTTRGSVCKVSGCACEGTGTTELLTHSSVWRTDMAVALRISDERIKERCVGWCSDSPSCPSYKTERVEAEVRSGCGKVCDSLECLTCPRPAFIQ